MLYSVLSNWISSGRGTYRPALLGTVEIDGETIEHILLFDGGEVNAKLNRNVEFVSATLRLAFCMPVAFVDGH